MRHVHLKDYNVQFTDEGYRLVRCAIGDGAVPFREMIAILAEHHETLTAVLELGALEARHVRLLTPEWWNGYPPKRPPRSPPASRRRRHRRLPDDADYRTPWERGDDGALVAYELDHDPPQRRQHESDRNDVKEGEAHDQGTRAARSHSSPARAAGLGRVMAERLAELGADVAIHDLDWTAPAKYGEAADLGAVAKEMEQYGTRTVAVTGNIGDPAAVAKMKADINGQARRRSTSWSIAPAATSAPRAASRTRTTPSTSPSRTSRR